MEHVLDIPAVRILGRFALHRKCGLRFFTAQDSVVAVAD